jgi:hypothetical protein
MDFWDEIFNQTVASNAGQTVDEPMEQASPPSEPMEWTLDDLVPSGSAHVAQAPVANRRATCVNFPSFLLELSFVFINV